MRMPNTMDEITNIRMANPRLILWITFLFPFLFLFTKNPILIYFVRHPFFHQCNPVVHPCFSFNSPSHKS